MGLLGIQKERLTFEKTLTTTTYVRNRLMVVTKATGKAAYATYGSVADGCTTYVDVEAADQRVAIYPLSGLRETFFLNALTAITKGALVFPATDGKVVASSYTAIAGITAVPGSPTEGDTYLLPAVPTGTGWEDHANAIAIRGASTWSYVDVDATTNLGLTVYLSDERRYYTWNGTAWVVATPAAVAMEAAVAGQDFVCYNLADATRLSVANMPAEFGFGAKLAIAASGAGGAAAASVLDNRVLTTDKFAVCLQSVANAVYLRTVTCSTAGTITCTFSADPGAWTATILVIRS